MYKVTVLYPQGELDEDYYAATHVPLLQKHAGALGMRRFFYEKPEPDPKGNPAQYRLVAHLFFDDAAGFQRIARSPEMGEIVGDVKNFYPGRIQMLTGTVIEPG